jgi:rubrerythrin
MSYIDTSPEAIQFTTAWWERTLKDEAALIRWLQKLRHTEYGGFEDYTGFTQRFAADERAKNQFRYIADDELKHSLLISELLRSRGHELDMTPTPSLFWGTMNEHIVDLQSAAAVNYFGEALAAFRFEILIAHEQTPKDIKDMLGIILPDEQFHREALMRMAGEDMIAKLAPIYNATVKALKGSK